MIQPKTNIMFKNFNIVPRWIIFLLDIGGTLFSLFLAIAIKQNLTLVGLSWEAVFNTFVLVLIINTLVFTSIKTYSGIVRYTGIQDAFRISISVIASAAFLFIAILTPILSGIADYLGNKKVFLKFFCYLGGLSCIGLYWFSLEHIYTSLLLYFMGLVGFWVSFA